MADGQVCLVCGWTWVPSTRGDFSCGTCGIGSKGSVAEPDPRDAEIARLTRERDEAVSRVERQTDWYQQRFNALREWVKEEVAPLNALAAHRYFAIIANGSPAPHESADWRETMHGLTLRAERAERERDENHALAGRIAGEWRERYANLEQRFTELAASESNKALRARVAELERALSAAIEMRHTAQHEASIDRAARDQAIREKHELRAREAAMLNSLRSVVSAYAAAKGHVLLHAIVSWIAEQEGKRGTNA